jgi:Fic/DOC family.
VIEQLMTELVEFIHADDELDPLLRMAIAHHQFESIHPFYDGNGRTGRILNLLILQREGLLDLPVLYLSRYITSTKTNITACCNRLGKAMIGSSGASISLKAWPLPPRAKSS